MGESTFVILPGLTPPTTPAASLDFVTAPSAIFDVVTELLLSCAEPTEAFFRTCPAQPVLPSAKNSARHAMTFAGVNSRVARLMLPPSRVCRVPDLGNRHRCVSS